MDGTYTEAAAHRPRPATLEPVAPTSPLYESLDALIKEAAMLTPTSTTEQVDDLRGRLSKASRKLVDTKQLGECPQDALALYDRVGNTRLRLGMASMRVLEDAVFCGHHNACTCHLVA